MRKKVEYYNGRKITKEVLKKVNLIELKSIEEGITQFGMGYVKTLSELSNSHKTKPKNEHLILGEDWYISYTTKKNNEIEINDWISITKVENKFEQTIEMFNAIKQILITYKDSNIITTLRHSTSYPFYKKFLDTGYLEELIDEVDFDDYLPQLEEINEKILEQYNGIEEYLLDPNRNRYEKYHIEDFIYHEVIFIVSEKFKNRYKNSGGNNSGNNKRKIRKRRLL